MLNLAARAADTAIAEPVDHSQYTVTSRLEITQILSAIMRQSALVTASPGPDSFFLTSILSIDQENDVLLLECSRQQAQIEQVLKKQRLTCSTALDKVKIEFRCENIEVVGDDRDRAFKMRLPRELLRLQRREHFRMDVPLAAQLKCTISPLEQDPAQIVRVELVVHDISCGGIAVITPPALFTPELGAQYNAVISLPGTGGVRALIQARNAFMITLANGKVTQRSGFAFIKPAESLLATVQRYIMHLERTRRMHNAGR